MTGADVDRERRDGAPNRDGTDPVGQLLTTVADDIGTDQERSWRLQVHAPRWSVTRRDNDPVAVALYVLAGALALAGVVLAIHFLDRFLPGAPQGARQAPLAVQIGSWLVVVLIFIGAVAAAGLGFRAPRLEVDLSAQPSAEADAERARELQNAAIAAIVAPLAQPNPPAADLAAVSERLQELLGSLQGGAATPAAAPSTSNPSSGSARTVVDPASTVSPKVVAGAAAGATSVAFWIVAASTFWHTLGPSVLAALSTAVTAGAGSIAAWLKRDPLRTTHTVESHPT
jgi:hypothetical protein